jgi:hypothetical protein
VRGSLKPNGAPLCLFCSIKPTIRGGSRRPACRATSPKAAADHAAASGSHGRATARSDRAAERSRAAPNALLGCSAALPGRPPCRCRAGPAGASTRRCRCDACQARRQTASARPGACGRGSLRSSAALHCDPPQRLPSPQKVRHFGLTKPTTLQKDIIWQQIPRSACAAHPTRKEGSVSVLLRHYRNEKLRAPARANAASFRSLIALTTNMPTHIPATVYGVLENKAFLEHDIRGRLAARRH